MSSYMYNESKKNHQALLEILEPLSAESKERHLAVIESLQTVITRQNLQIIDLISESNALANEANTINKNTESIIKDLLNAQILISNDATVVNKEIVILLKNIVTNTTKVKKY